MVAPVSVTTADAEASPKAIKLPVTERVCEVEVPTVTVLVDPELE